MATLFYPGCQIKKDYPEASKKLAEYIQSKRPVEVVGCCRVDHGKSTQEDTALVVCNNCANIIAAVSYTHLDVYKRQGWRPSG